MFDDSRFLDEGTAASSISPQSDVVDANEMPCDSPATGGAKRTDPFTSLQDELVMVSRDHIRFDSAAAFFRESIRRVAMTGTKIVFALRNEKSETAVLGFPRH